MLKKVTSIVLAAVLVISTMPATSNAEAVMVTRTELGFKDMPDNWATDSLIKAVENGLLKGSNGKIKPDNNLTRAEMATMINRAVRAYEEGNIEGYKDISKKDWFYSEMAKSVKMGTFKGYENKLKANESISREEAFVVIARVLKLEKSNVKPEGINDLDKISNWTRGEVYSLAEKGYIQGSKGLLNPKKNITRAEFAKLMDNIIFKYISTPGMHDYLNGEIKGNVIVNVPAGIIKNAKIKGDLIIGEGVSTQDTILDNVEVSGRVIVRGGGELVLSNGTKVDKVYVDKTSGDYSIIVNTNTLINDVSLEDKTWIKGNGKIKRINLLKGSDSSVLDIKDSSIKNIDGVKGVTSFGKKI